MDQNAMACRDGYAPKGLLLQWHITNRCNLRCAHCYQDSYGGEERPVEELLQVLRQYEELLAAWRTMPRSRGVKGHITVTGGEPFVHPDFMELLHEFALRRNEFTFGILTNGMLIDEAKALCLRELRPHFVQVSLEGGRETHDAIRGPGNYEEVVASVRRMVRVGIRVMISFTAHRQNFREFPQVARTACELGVSRVWTDRLIPSGTGKSLQSAVMSPEETREYCHLISTARRDQNTRKRRTEISGHRALQFLTDRNRIYHCTAGDSLLTVMPNGDVYPCRRMPVKVGNVFETPLRAVYDGSPILRSLRDPANTAPECGACWFRNQCRGGLKCLSFAVYGNPFRADPGCWLVPTADRGESASAAPKPESVSCGPQHQGGKRPGKLLLPV